MQTQEQLRREVSAAYDDFLHYRASDATRALVTLLDALAAATLGDLESVGSDGLARKQGALAQLRALRTAIVAPGPHVSPKT